MKCPKCTDRELAAVKSEGSAGVMSCANCGGVWVDGAKARDIGRIPLPSDLVSVEHNRDTDLQAGVCPNGHGILKRAQTHLVGGFYLERCESCFGVWFDQGELQRVLEQGLSDGLFQIWTSLWQREQIELHSRERYEEEILQKLGDELIEQLDRTIGMERDHPHKSLALGYLMKLLRE